MKICISSLNQMLPHLAILLCSNWFVAHFTVLVSATEPAFDWKPSLINTKLNLGVDLVFLPSL